MTLDIQNQTGRNTHMGAEEARELKQDFPAALAAADQAMHQYALEGNIYGVSEALCSRALALRHMADALKVEAFRIQALHEAMAAVQIAEENGVSTAIALLNLGKLQREFGDSEEALETFRKAAEAQRTNPHSTQDRPGVLANFEEMLATAELAAGDDSALERAETALTALEASDEDSLNRAIWLSHGHGRIAVALRERNPEVARRHYDAAKAIIEGDERLKLSAGKLEKLKAEFEGEE